MISGLITIGVLTLIGIVVLAVARRESPEEQAMRVYREGLHCEPGERGELP